MAAEGVAPASRNTSGSPVITSYSIHYTKLYEILEDGFFHADVHPGNLFYLPDNRIALIDFGMVGRLSEERRLQVALLLHGLVSRDADSVTEVLLDWGGGGEADLDGLRAELDGFVDQYHGVPLKRLDLGAMLSDLLSIMRYIV